MKNKNNVKRVAVAIKLSDAAMKGLVGGNAIVNAGPGPRPPPRPA
jgi:hypothetical protein